MTGTISGTPEEAEVRDPSAADVVNGDALAHVHRELEVAAGEKPARLRQPHVAVDEVVSRNAVAIGEDHVVGARGGDRAIDDLPFPEPTVLVPDVGDPQA